jgi:predicted RNase H-like nuclease (RuvC/YqgF family)
MHEMCSMVEEIAQLSKNLELQIQAKKPEIENASLNIANLQRKVDEQTTRADKEFVAMKRRQYELTDLFSTSLEEQ